MGIRLAAYLKRNRFGVFYYRRVVPPELRSFFVFTQISRSTRTSSRDEARSLALRFSASVDLLFSRLRAMSKRKRPEEALKDCQLAVVINRVRSCPGLFAC